MLSIILYFGFAFFFRGLCCFVFFLTKPCFEKDKSQITHLKRLCKCAPKLAHNCSLSSPQFKEPEKQRVYHAATYNNFTDIFIFYGALHNNNLLISFDVADLST